MSVDAQAPAGRDAGQSGDAVIHFIDEALALQLAVVAKGRPGFLRFIHMNHTNPVLRDESLRRDMEARGYRIATQHERVRF